MKAMYRTLNVNALIYVSIILALSLYFKGVTSSVFLQPSLYFFVVVLFFLIALSTKGLKWYSSYNGLLLLVIYNAGLIAFQNYDIGLKSVLTELGRVVFPIFCALACIVVFKRLGDGQYRRSLNFVLKWFVFLLVIDLFFRLLDSGFNRYLYKIGGLIYVDSNFSGTLSFIVYCMVKDRDYIPSSVKNGLFVLIALSSSYAVYIGLLVYILVRNKWLRLVFPMAFVVSIVLFIQYSDVLSDLGGSLATKVLILEAALGVFDFDAKTLLFGVGSGLFNTVFEVRFPSHNLFGLIAELGIVWLLLNLAVFYFSLFKNHRIVLYMMLFVGFFSLYPIAYLAPVFFIVVAMKYADNERLAYVQQV